MPRIKRPSPSMAISLLALFVALGGTGYAAVKINGKSIKAGTITGKKLKNDTITGKQVKESRLGMVPKARTATTAHIANGLSNAARAGFLSTAKVGSSGLVKLPMAASLADAPKTPILEKAPFSASARCYDDGTGKQVLKVGLESTVPDSDVNDVIGTADDNFMNVTASAPGVFASDLDFATLATPTGKTLVMTGHGGVNGLGAACFISVNSLSHQ
ncbi:MAG: hypothetical protein ACJ74O_05025 [Frankiaceae bacterium]